MVASIAIGALITIVGLLFRNPILRMLGADEMVMPYAQDYFSIFTVLPFLIFFYSA